MKLKFLFRFQIESSASFFTRPEAIMLQILSIMLFGNSIKFTQLCAPFTPQLNFFLFVLLHIPIPHGAEFTATFLLRAKSNTFGTLSLSRIVGAEVGFSSPSLTFNLWLESVNTLLEDATLLMVERCITILCT